MKSLIVHRQKQNCFRLSCVPRAFYIFKYDPYRGPSSLHPWSRVSVSSCLLSDGSWFPGVLVGTSEMGLMSAVVCSPSPVESPIGQMLFCASCTGKMAVDLLLKGATNQVWGKNIDQKM